MTDSATVRLEVLVPSASLFGLVALWALFEVFSNVILLYRNPELRLSVSGSRARQQMHIFLFLGNASRAVTLLAQLIVTDLAGVHEWWRCLMHFTPDVFFIVLYAVLIAFWATLYYEKPREFERLTIVFWLVALCLGLAYAGIAVATYLTHSYHLFWQLIEGIFGGTAIIGLGMALFYGCNVARKLRPRPEEAMEADSVADAVREASAQRTVMRRVFVLCFLCVLFLLIRGAANLLAVTRVMDNCDGFFLPPHSACSYSPKFELYTMCFDVVMCCITELVPSIVMLLVTRRQKQPASDDEYSEPDVTRGESDPDVLEEQHYLSAPAAYSYSAVFADNRRHSSEARHASAFTRNRLDRLDDVSADSLLNFQTPPITGASLVDVTDDLSGTSAARLGRRESSFTSDVQGHPSDGGVHGITADNHSVGSPPTSHAAIAAGGYSTNRQSLLEGRHGILAGARSGGGGGGGGGGAGYAYRTF